MENYIGISLLKHYFENAAKIIIDAEINNNLPQLERILIWLDMELSNLCVASDGILKITYDDDYLEEREHPISYTSVYYMLYGVQNVFKGVTSVFFDLYYTFLKKDGVLV